MSRPLPVFTTVVKILSYESVVIEILVKTKIYHILPGDFCGSTNVGRARYIVSNERGHVGRSATWTRRQGDQNTLTILRSPYYPWCRQHWVTRSLSQPSQDTRFIPDTSIVFLMTNSLILPNFSFCNQYWYEFEVHYLLNEQGIFSYLMIAKKRFCLCDRGSNRRLESILAKFLTGSLAQNLV